MLVVISSFRHRPKNQKRYIILPLSVLPASHSLEIDYFCYNWGFYSTDLYDKYRKILITERDSWRSVSHIKIFGSLTVLLCHHVSEWVLYSNQYMPLKGNRDPSPWRYSNFDCDMRKFHFLQLNKLPWRLFACRAAWIHSLGFWKATTATVVRCCYPLWLPLLFITTIHGNSQKNRTRSFHSSCRQYLCSLTRMWPTMSLCCGSLHLCRYTHVDFLQNHSFHQLAGGYCLPLPPHLFAQPFL